ncbi:Hypothetical protein FKW44_019129, partial [Caligus rogercresseyi]
MEQVPQSFMVDLDVDSKNASVAGQALDMCLKLWLLSIPQTLEPLQGFLLFLEQRQVQCTIFLQRKQ